MNRVIARAVMPAAVAELQAISIYESEIFFLKLRPWLRPGALAPFLEILEEERAHAGSMREWTRVPAALAALNILAGWMLGLFFACLPMKLVYLAHDWAEVQAARSYTDALRAARSRLASEPGLLPAAEWERLSGALSHAEAQELEHARRFGRLARGGGA